MVRRIARLQYRLFDRMRHREAFGAAEQEPIDGDFESFQAHHYCLLVTFKRSGDPVPTPVLFGIEDGKLYLRTDAVTAKVARIRNDERVLVGPANSRGKPRGPLVRGIARVLTDGAEHAQAVGALREKYVQYRAMALEQRPVIARGEAIGAGRGSRLRTSRPRRPRRSYGAPAASHHWLRCRRSIARVVAEASGVRPLRDGGEPTLAGRLAVLGRRVALARS